MKGNQATHLVVLPMSWLSWQIHFLKVLQTCILPLSGTNWVGQILSDLVTIFEKKMKNKESNVNEEELEEFPYFEIGDTGKYEVGTEYI